MALAAAVRFLRSARRDLTQQIYCSDRTGTWQVWHRDRRTETERRLTDHPDGVNYAVLSPDGRRLLWFDTTSGNEVGVWKEQPVSAPLGHAVPVSGLSPAHAHGIEVGDEVTVAGFGSVDGFAVYRIRDGAAEAIYRHDEHPMRVSGLSADDSLVAIQHAERGDPDRPGIRVLSVDTGETVGELLDPDRQLVPVAFSPRRGDHRLVVQHERNGQWELLLWEPTTGAVRELPIDAPGEVANRWVICKYDQLVRWSPDATRLTLALDDGPNTSLYDYELRAGSQASAMTRLPSPEGTIDELVTGPAGEVEFRWGSLIHPWQYRTVADSRPLVAASGDAALPEIRTTELAVPGPGGDIPVLLVEPASARPAGGRPLLVGPHGGPQERFGNRPLIAMYADAVRAGCLVALPEYRGSIGYGSAWRYGARGRVGLAESDDLRAVIAHLVEAGAADPGRVAVAGASYGGYLGLMTAGRFPGSVTGGVVAAVPICDLIAMRADPARVPEMESFWDARVGGSPASAPEAWHDGSPISYVESTTSPVLITYNRDDPRCGPAQVENYLARADDLGRTNITAARFAGGHSTIYQTSAVTQSIRQRQDEFLVRQLGLASTAVIVPSESRGTVGRATASINAAVAAWTLVEEALSAVAGGLTEVSLDETDEVRRSAGGSTLSGLHLMVGAVVRELSGLHGASLANAEIAVRELAVGSVVTVSRGLDDLGDQLGPVPEAADVLRAHRVSERVDTAVTRLQELSRQLTVLSRS